MDGGPPWGGYYTMINIGSGETGSLCYWNFCEKEEFYLDENYLCQCERIIELKEFMQDWDEYVGEYDG